MGLRFSVHHCQSHFLPDLLCHLVTNPFFPLHPNSAHPALFNQFPSLTSYTGLSAQAGLGRSAGAWWNVLVFAGALAWRICMSCQSANSHKVVYAGGILMPPTYESNRTVNYILGSLQLRKVCQHDCTHSVDGKIEAEKTMALLMRTEYRRG